MARADRLERLDSLCADLESVFRQSLIRALEATAAGSWGLFDHQQDRYVRARVAPIVTELCETGEEIDRLRKQLGLEPFPLYQEFVASRGRVASNAVGEPKQARSWLERLGHPAPLKD